MSHSGTVEVIIRSTLEATRKEQIQRAIRSIQQQSDVHAVPIVVANGNRCDASIMAALQGRSDIRFTYFSQASTGRAMRVGREMVTAPFFAFLDDDDELLPDALSTRLGFLRENPLLDIVVTTGYFEKSGVREIHIPDIVADQDDPLFAITRHCWLSSCGGLFRSDKVTADFFDGTTDYLELTLLAFRLAMADLKIRFVDEPTYIVHDTANSLSKSRAHAEASEAVIAKMLRYHTPAYVRRSLEHKYRNILHVLAETYSTEGQRLKAWRYHFRSMRPPHTFHYLAFTRKLIAMMVGG